MKRILVAMAVLLTGFVATTWWVLESGGVAVVETHASDGTVRSTHVWYVEPDGELWLEAGTPTNGWYLDIQENPKLSFSTEAGTTDYRAEPVHEPDVRQRIRRLIRDKYGFRDRWVGTIIDTSNSVAVRLVPAS